MLVVVANFQKNETPQSRPCLASSARWRSTSNSFHSGSKTNGRFDKRKLVGGGGDVRDRNRDWLKQRTPLTNTKMDKKDSFNRFLNHRGAFFHFFGNPFSKHAAGRLASSPHCWTAIALAHVLFLALQGQLQSLSLIVRTQQVLSQIPWVLKSTQVFTSTIMNYCKYPLVN